MERIFQITTLRVSMEKVHEKLPEQILSFDETSPVHLKEKHRLRIEDFDGTKDWETAVITYCIINAVSMKNALFNQNVRKQKSRKGEHSIRPKRDELRLKRAK